jgi:hypothetical protein
MNKIIEKYSMEGRKIIMDTSISPHECSYKISLLAKECYSEDPDSMRPYIQKLKDSVLQDLCHSESGMYIGEGYHGGNSREEWTYINETLIKAKNILDELI